MFETFGIMLREGMEIALVVGIILAYLGNTNRKQLNKYVYMGIAAAVTGSLLTALAIQMLLAQWTEVFEGLLYFIAAFFIISMLVWMHKVSKNIKQDIEQGVESAVNTKQAVGIFTLTFFMIYREGAEIVMFLSAMAQEAKTIVALEGAAGLSIAAIFGYLFIVGSLRIDLSKFFRITGAMLSIIVFQLFIGGIHEWEEAGIINPGPTGIQIIDTLSGESAETIFTGIMFGFLLLLFILVGVNKRHSDVKQETKSIAPSDG